MKQKFYQKVKFSKVLKLVLNTTYVFLPKKIFVNSGSNTCNDLRGRLNCVFRSAPVKVLKEIELTEEEYAFAISKNNDSLLTSVNEYLAEWKADGSLDTLINSYFDGTATFSYANKTSSPQEGDFVVATNAYFPPFESYNDNSDFEGVDIEIAYNIAQKLNKTLYVKDNGVRRYYFRRTVGQQRYRYGGYDGKRGPQKASRFCNGLLHLCTSHNRSGKRRHVR